MSVFMTVLQQPNKDIPWILHQFTVHPPAYGKLNETKLLKSQQNEEGYTNTV